MGLAVDGDEQDGAEAEVGAGHLLGGLCHGLSRLGGGQGVGGDPVDDGHLHGAGVLGRDVARVGLERELAGASVGVDLDEVGGEGHAVAVELEGAVGVLGVGEGQVVGAVDDAGHGAQARLGAGDHLAVGQDVVGHHREARRDGTLALAHLGREDLAAGAGALAVVADGDAAAHDNGVLGGAPGGVELERAVGRHEVAVEAGGVLAAERVGVEELGVLADGLHGEGQRLVAGELASEAVELAALGDAVVVGAHLAPDREVGDLAAHGDDVLEVAVGAGAAGHVVGRGGAGDDVAEGRVVVQGDDVGVAEGVEVGVRLDGAHVAVGVGSGAAGDGGRGRLTGDAEGRAAGEAVDVRWGGGAGVVVLLKGDAGHADVDAD